MAPFGLRVSGVEFSEICQRLGLSDAAVNGGDWPVTGPTDGRVIATVKAATSANTDRAIALSKTAFEAWRQVPAPRRGELIRVLGNKLRENKEALGALVTLECGKIYEEGLGEVQEMIDVCDLAVGLSRQLHGLTIASERPGHRMSETWHPMGPVAVISAFNFPVAVWSWNATLAVVCGNSVIWKPSEKTPLCALACQQLFNAAAREVGDVPEGLLQVLVGDGAIGAQLAADSRIPVVSATGSTRMGRQVAPVVAERFGRTILELGGNNAIIVADSADLDMAVRAITFGAVGTAGQRCTTTRRVIAHESIYPALLDRLKSAFNSVRVGAPMAPETLVGPLIDEASFTAMQHALQQHPSEQVFGGDRVLLDEYPNAFYVRPAIVELPDAERCVQQETFAPVLYTYRYKEFETALRLQNDVPQGLSSAIFTRDLREAERFTAAMGSDCGIANVNIGTSGAEIGGAFGGEKETGGGRESGSDAWKAYMRRQTSTVNYSDDMPLAQGIRFDL